MIRAKQNTKRRGGLTVEFAVVATILAVMLFGIMEFCMLIYTYNVVENAAREGARYAVVNTQDGSMVSDTQAVAKTFMSGLDTKMKNYSCTVYLADANGNNIGSATDAQFGQYVCVDISIEYVPMTPGLSYVKTTKIRSRCNMASEAN